jgi:hypothetical protein
VLGVVSPTSTYIVEVLLGAKERTYIVGDDDRVGPQQPILFERLEVGLVEILPMIDE